MSFDHACTLPLKLLWPEGDCPVTVVPICINTVQFPLPKASRVYAMGRAVGEAVEAGENASVRKVHSNYHIPISNTATGLLALEKV